VCAPYIRISEPERMRAPAHGGKGDQGNDTPILFVRVSTGRRSLVFYRTRRSDTWPICHGAQRRQGGTRAMGEGRRCKVKLIKEPSGGRCHVKQPLRETVEWNGSQITDLPPADATYPGTRILNVTTPAECLWICGQSASPTGCASLVSRARSKNASAIAVTATGADIEIGRATP
jgi:hypothetical protein